MKKLISSIIRKNPRLYSFVDSIIRKNPRFYMIIQFFRPHILFLQLFGPQLKSVRGDLQSVHDEYKSFDNTKTIAVDLGCGPNPMNRFGANKAYGVDLYEDAAKGVFKCRLGFEKLPFDDDSLDYLTAYDVLEHIPRYSDNSQIGNVPFIYLMNECFRVLKKGGLFLSMTPIYPYLGAFQDPTHNNIMTVQTFQYYFSKEKLPIANHYGIKADFEIKYQRMLGQHLVAVLQK